MVLGVIVACLVRGGALRRVRSGSQLRGHQHLVLGKLLVHLLQHVGQIISLRHQLVVRVPRQRARVLEVGVVLVDNGQRTAIWRARHIAANLTTVIRS